MTQRIHFMLWTVWYNISYNTPGCFAQLGKAHDSLQPQPFNLDRTDRCIIQQVIIHEALHTVGLQHEHQRPDLDSFLRVNLTNLNPGNRTQFDINNDVETFCDVYSIMHYQCS